MTSSASLTVNLTGPDDRLQLVYLKEDNLLPSEVAKAAETTENVAAGCNSVSPGSGLSVAEKNAALELLHHEDQHAWPFRKLRLYPAVNASLRCSTGQVALGHLVEEEQVEVLTFSGSDQGSLEHRGDPFVLEAVGRVYDELGNEVLSPSLQYRGNGTVTADRKIWGLFAAKYNTAYRVVNLGVTATGKDFDCLVSAFFEEDTAAATVKFEVLEFETGQVAGVNCGGGNVNVDTPPVVVPPPVARYQIVRMDHAGEVKKGDSLSVILVIKNINRVAGSGSASFGLKYTPNATSAVFSCEASGQVQVNLSLAMDKEGHFQTVGDVYGDFFSQQTGAVVVRPSEEQAKEWTETTRTMTDVDVEGVLIKRIENVTFDTDGNGSLVKLIFDNTGVL
jgi:hypothetical protein